MLSLPSTDTTDRVGTSSAGAELGAAADILSSCPRPSMAATAIADVGSALLEAGHRPEGVDRLEQAWTRFQAIGSVGAALGVQRVLAAAGVRRRRTTGRRPSTGWASLTDTETRVARLIADGRTNRTAAQEMGISVNTVGTHVSSMFAKLGVRSRLQLSHAVRAATKADFPVSTQSSVSAQTKDS